jgi:mono/diheme cytochrome c family protein
MNAEGVFMSSNYTGRMMRTNNTQRPGFWKNTIGPRCFLAAAAAILVGILFAPAAQSADAPDTAEGMRLFLQKANCQACHGWAGDGRKMDNQMPDGSNLRETALDRAAVILTIKCGRPGRSMPAFDKLAYSDGRCYGMKEPEAKKLGLFDPPATLQPREIETLADFLFAKIIRKGAMDRAKCVEYWGSETDVCRDLK